MRRLNPATVLAAIAGLFAGGPVHMETRTEPVRRPRRRRKDRRWPKVRGSGVRRRGRYAHARPDPIPTHPRERWYYMVGRMGGRVLHLEFDRPGAGGSYLPRYRACYEAGRKAGGHA